MVVISPCDAIEARKATLAAAKTNTPVYLRLARDKSPIITTEDTLFEIGKSQVFWTTENPQAVIIATGALVAKALRVAKTLEGTGARVKVLNLATIKPLDKEVIVSLAKEAGAVVTVEEHQIRGGMGSAIAECLAEAFPVPVEFVGVRDQFGQSGTPDELIEHYGMGEKSILEAVRKVIQRKNGNKS
jgi:transketolase